MSKATIEGCQRYAQKFPQFQYSELGKTGLMVSQTGFGAYRVNNQDEEQKAALYHALTHGVNVIDTSSNYTDGESESCIGTVISNGCSDGILTRDELVLVTKAGYIQGKNYEIAESKKASGSPFPEIVEYEDGLWHCIHPDFLKEQLEQSLERLQVETIDVFLLHNPEYYKLWAAKQGLKPEEINSIYYRRIKQAFAYLEEEVANGRIGFYGVSSNTFPLSDSQIESTSLEKVCDIADSLSPDHHFAVAQCPANFFETQALIGDSSFIQVARERQIGVLFNRPLNAIKEGQLIRLTDVEEQVETSYMEVSDVLERSLEVESEFKEELGKVENMPEELVNAIAFFQSLKPVFNDDLSLFRFKELLLFHFYPQLNQLAEYVVDIAASDEIQEHCYAYLQQFNVLATSITYYLSSLHQSKMNSIKSTVISHSAELGDAFQMSHMAIRALRSVDGVSTVLVGMRRKNYVENILEESAQPMLKDADSFWSALPDLKDAIV